MSKKRQSLKAKLFQMFGNDKEQIDKYMRIFKDTRPKEKKRAWYEGPQPTQRPYEVQRMLDQLKVVKATQEYERNYEEVEEIKQYVMRAVEREANKLAGYEE